MSTSSHPPQIRRLPTGARSFREPESGLPRWAVKARSKEAVVPESNENAYLHRRVGCPACGASETRGLLAVDYLSPDVRAYLERFYTIPGEEHLHYLAGATYALDECPGCGLIFQVFAPGDELLQRLYGTWIASRDPAGAIRKKSGLGNGARSAHELMRLIATLGLHPSEIRVLDFGMGWGHWALMAKAFGCQVWGAELAEDRRAHAREWGISLAEWDELPGMGFHLVNTEQVFEHLVDPVGVVEQLGLSLAGGGLLKISVPTARDIKRRLEGWDWAAPKGTPASLNAVAPLEHLNCFNRSSLRALAARAGLTEVDVPLGVQYRFPGDLGGVRMAIRAAIRPVFHRVLRRENYAFFRRDARS